MIINLLLSVFLSIFQGILYFLPVVTIADIPVIGSIVQSSLITMVQTWNAFIVTFPYAGTVSTVFFAVIIPFEFLMLVGKFLLGHRMPASNEK